MTTMEKATLFTRCMWLITTINAAGSMTKAEIDATWRRSSVNDAKETGIQGSDLEVLFFRDR